MRPIPGRTAVAEYDTRFDADLGRARLLEAGLEAVVICDPAHAVAPHLVTDHGFWLVVRDEVADHARQVLTDGLPPDLEAAELDAAFYRRRLADRPTWVRATAWLLGLSVIGPFAWVAVTYVLMLIRDLYP